MPSTVENKVPQSVKPARQESAQALLEKAVNQPGVQELMRVYGESERYERALDVYAEAAKGQTRVWTSSSTVG